MALRMKKNLCMVLLFILIHFIIQGCCCFSSRRQQRVTDRRPPTESLPAAMLDQITVEDLRVTCDLMARDLILQPFIQNAKSTPIIAVKPIENKTSLTIDPDIFQKTIRVKLMERAGGRVLFRDEASYQYTIDERMKQADGKVQIETTTTRRRTRAPTGIGEPLQIQEQGQTDTTMIDEGEVEKKVADIDYFLTGLVFSSTEVTASDAPQGMRYFQFQFRYRSPRRPGTSPVGE